MLHFQREKTLLQEYKVRHKTNVFLDRRIGENDSHMDPEKKMALRLAAEKRRQFGKVNIINALSRYIIILLHTMVAAFYVLDIQKMCLETAKHLLSCLSNTDNDLKFLGCICDCCKWKVLGS